MGLIRTALNSASSVISDQWKEYFYCEALPNDILMAKGEKRTSGRFRSRGNDNIISNGSVIAVADGQCMLIVEQGKVVEVCAEPGEFIYDTSTEPSLFAGNLGNGIGDVFRTIGKRFTFGGETPKDQRVYYFNTREIIGNKYGTPNPIIFHVVDKEAHFSIDVPIRCFGEYSYRLTNPLLFYTKVSGNTESVYNKESLDSQMKSELLSAMQPAFARIAEMGIPYFSLAGHTQEICSALKTELSVLWGEGRGIEIVNFGISSIKGDEEVEAMMRDRQMESSYDNDPGRMAAHLGRAQAEAMKMAASNPSAGSAMAFMGMGMANQSGFNLGSMYQQGMQQKMEQQQRIVEQQAAQKEDIWNCSACGQTGNTGKFCSGCGKSKPVAEDIWICSCGTTVSGKFCPECGKARPTASSGWVCTSCGTVNKGKFCVECGSQKPANVPQYKCDKCGWEPKDPTHPPKFCPECGDPFDDGDIQ